MLYSKQKKGWHNKRRGSTKLFWRRDVISRSCKVSLRRNSAPRVGFLLRQLLCLFTLAIFIGKISWFVYWWAKKLLIANTGTDVCEKTWLTRAHTIGLCLWPHDRFNIRFTCSRFFCLLNACWFLIPSGNRNRGSYVHKSVLTAACSFRTKHVTWLRFYHTSSSVMQDTTE